MKEISLNILDIVRNSVEAGAKKLRIEIRESDQSDAMMIKIIDNGCGMEEEFLQRVEDPFTTSRKTRKVGMGIPLLKMQAKQAGGALHIESQPGIGTKLTATFMKSHIDRQPMGDIIGVIKLLLMSEKGIDIDYYHSTDKGGCEFSSKEAKEVLGVTSFNEPGLAREIANLLKENLLDIGAEIN